MTYEEKKKLIEAANLLKEACREKIKGDKKCDCIFAKGEKCTLLEEYPCDWYMPKVTRWTPEDVALAKALKAVGATHIYGDDYDFRAWSNDEKESGYLPKQSFQYIKFGEAVKIDDIIKESEE